MTYDQKEVDFSFSINNTSIVNRAGNGTLTKDFGSVMRRFKAFWLKGETGLRSRLKVTLAVDVYCG
mgnify:CR=1 FL=1